VVGVRVRVGAVGRQVAADPPVGAQHDQQQPDTDREDDVAHPERQHVERRLQQRHVHQCRDEEQRAQRDHHRGGGPRAAHGRTEEHPGDDDRQERQQPVRRQAEQTLAVRGQERNPAGQPQHAEDQQEEPDAERAQALDGIDPLVDDPLVEGLGPAGAVVAEVQEGHGCLPSERTSVIRLACSSEHAGQPRRWAAIPGTELSASAPLSSRST
jgi:hypothetical protein